MSCWVFVVGTVASVIIGYIPRRYVFLYSSISMVFVYTGWIAASAVYTNNKSHAAGSAVIAMLPLFFLAFQPGMSCLTYVYGAEIWPYTLRAKGITLLQVMSRGLQFIGTFCNPIGLEKEGYRYLFLYWSVLLIEVVTIYFFYPETKGLSLEEIKIVFDGSDEQTMAAMAVDVEPGKGRVEYVENVPEHEA
jgi:hypothetical protein